MTSISPLRDATLLIVALAPGGSADQLAKLADLRDRGVITDAEFQAERPKSCPDLAYNPWAVTAGDEHNGQSLLPWARSAVCGRPRDVRVCGVRPARPARRTWVSRRAAWSTREARPQPSRSPSP